jgi:hypothetical protein
LDDSDAGCKTVKILFQKIMCGTTEELKTQSQYISSLFPILISTHTGADSKPLDSLDQYLQMNYKPLFYKTLWWNG